MSHSAFTALYGILIILKIDRVCCHMRDGVMLYGVEADVLDPNCLSTFPTLHSDILDMGMSLSAAGFK